MSDLTNKQKADATAFIVEQVEDMREWFKGLEDSFGTEMSKTALLIYEQRIKLVYAKGLQRAIELVNRDIKNCESNINPLTGKVGSADKLFIAALQDLKDSLLDELALLPSLQPVQTNLIDQVLAKKTLKLQEPYNSLPAEGDEELITGG